MTEQDLQKIKDLEEEVENLRAMCEYKKEQFDILESQLQDPIEKFAEMYATLLEKAIDAFKGYSVNFEIDGCSFQMVDEQPHFEMGKLSYSLTPSSTSSIWKSTS